MGFEQASQFTKEKAGSESEDLVEFTNENQRIMLQPRVIAYGKLQKRTGESITLNVSVWQAILLGSRLGFSPQIVILMISDLFLLT